MFIAEQDRIITNLELEFDRKNTRFKDQENVGFFRALYYQSNAYRLYWIGQSSIQRIW